MSAIEWTDVTWNPATGCTKVSPGCAHCYAEAIAPRTFKGRPFTDVRFHPERIEQPLRWRKPRRVFVNSMSDLFHEDLTFDQIDRVFSVMAAAQRHSYQVLTKRPERMREYFSGDAGDRVCGVMQTHPDPYKRQTWPLENVWLGVSVENQRTADERIPLLLDTPAALRFLSVEPLLDRVDLSEWVFNRRESIRDAMNGPAALNGDQADAAVSYPIDWVIVGGESGPKARPCNLEHVRSVVWACQRAGIPVFVKQLGAHHGSDRKGGDPYEWPGDLRVREFPR